MKVLPRILMILAAASLAGIFFFPIWSITLIAPQYPDGISMFIWINKITGDTPGTLQNINILNHYVGMKYIEPGSIPELRYFQWVIVAMGAAALAVSFSKNKYFFLTWVVSMVVLGGLGIYDFYLWEYDYGHNLSPTAPIKVPDMAYQPPLFGKKVLLNFIAYSYPSWGSLFFGLAILFGSLGTFLSWKRKRSG
jgi:hypothetical protein